VSASPGRQGGRFSHAKRALTTRTAEEQEPGSVLARARVEKAVLTEEYFYQQDVSSNRSTSREQQPVGHIEFVVPYDGDRYFTRAAQADVAKAARSNPDAQVTEAQIGHLLLTDHQSTDLGQVLHLNDRYDSVPIRVPMTVDGGLDQLTSDRLNCVTTYDYVINDPRELPVSVGVELLDPDSLYTIETSNDLQGQPASIAQHASFQPFLLLRLTVSITVPRSVEQGEENQDPVVKKVSIEWPTITSLAALTLFVGKSERPDSIVYNPLNRCIEWQDVTMATRRASENGKTVTYRSHAMVLSIGQPGELYERRSIGGEVEVEIPGQLLSGVRARLYDGQGRRDVEPLLMTSRVRTKLKLFLGDAFSRRTMTPYQLLHFDEVIPDPMRFTDIEHALKDRGFTIQRDRSTVVFEGKQYIVATRSAGPAIMTLFLYVDGARYQTERKKQAGGDTYTSQMESGELKVHMSGELAGNSVLLTHEMNALQRALRDKFEHLRSRH
jgi:hypothetical protein